jgi:hypothetical protein
MIFTCDDKYRSQNIGLSSIFTIYIFGYYRPLAGGWEMPKETINDSSEGDLVWLKYTFSFGYKFDEPNDDWLKSIETTNDELLEAYSKTKDNALSAAFGGRRKKILNRVFDAIGFVYPDYRYPLRGQGKKRKTSAPDSPDNPVLKGKKLKVLTHRPRYIEPTVVPEFGAGTSSAAERKETASTTQSTEEPAVMPKVPIAKEVETKVDKVDEPKIEEITKMPYILSALTRATVPNVQTGSIVTPKRRRMVNVLDVLETTDSISPAPTGKVAEADKTQPKAYTKQIEVEATITQAETEAGPTVPTETKLATAEQRAEGITPDTNIAFDKSVAEEAEFLKPNIMLGNCSIRRGP